MNSRVSVLVGLALAFLVSNQAVAQKGKGSGDSTPPVYYRVTAIENPLPDSPLSVVDLSGTGEAVGYIRGPEERIPFVWTTSTGLVPLQILLSEQDQLQWHLEVAEQINDSGRIVGFASVQGEDENENWAAYRLDWHDGVGAQLTILEEGLRNGEGSIQISNSGDVALGVYAKGAFFYPSDFPSQTKLDLQVPLYLTGINSFGEIIGDTDAGWAKLTLNANGGYGEQLFPAGYALDAINDAGTIAGQYNDGRVKYLFRYADDRGESILKDGRKIVGLTSPYGTIAGMNDEGDIGLTGPAIHTAGKYLKLNDLIHPDDLARYQGFYVRGIASRNETGLPPVIVHSLTDSTTGLRDSYLLTPELSSN